MGIKIKAKVKIKHNYKKMETISNQLGQVVSNSIEDVLNNIKGYAIRLEKGHNTEGILCEMVDMSTKEVKGRVYADPTKFMSNGQSYLWFEYFGTGAMAEMPHVGHTKHFVESGYTQWFIPVTIVEKPLNYPIVEIQGVQFYIAHGVKANHFLTDAEFKSRDENVEIVKQKLEEMLRRVCK